MHNEEGKRKGFQTRASLMCSFAISPYSFMAALLGALTASTASLENGTEGESADRNAGEQWKLF